MAKCRHNIDKLVLPLAILLYTIVYGQTGPAPWIVSFRSILVAVSASKNMIEPCEKLISPRLLPLPALPWFLHSRCVNPRERERERDCVCVENISYTAHSRCCSTPLYTPYIQNNIKRTIFDDVEKARRILKRAPKGHQCISRRRTVTRTATAPASPWRTTNSTTSNGKTTRYTLKNQLFDPKKTYTFLDY